MTELASPWGTGDPLSVQREGEELLKRVWDAMREGQWDLIGGLISPGFQSVHMDGARSREHEIELLKGLDLSDFMLRDILVTRTGPVMVVTYAVTVAETIGGQRVPAHLSPRMSVFLKTDEGWRWISHANLTPIQ